MKKILHLLLLLFSVYSYSSEINGNVFLDNTSDHSGIIIKFNPVSPSAVYTDGTSNTSGSYSISVINGIYDISYEKNGYQTYIITNQFISADESFPNVTLNSNTVVNISGNISGNWSNTNTYIVNGDITIPSGQTLTIEQGTEIKFDGYHSLIVNGTLNAIGSENNNIKFTSISTSPSNEDWNQILINNSNTLSILEYCTIEYGKKSDNDWTGIVQIYGKANIINCTIRNSGGSGIYVSSNEDILINKNIIQNCTVGVKLSEGGIFNVTDNKIYNISISGIFNRISAVNSVIESNIIENSNWSGIEVYSDNRIRYNIVSNSKYGIYAGKGTPEITQNTLISNQNGITIHFSESFNPNPIVSSNIIAYSSGYAIYSDGTPKPSSVTYNLFYGNTLGIGNNNLPIGTGSVITTNNNDTDSDTYYNIFSSPDFISTNPTDSDFCQLNSNSDAIDAGDPNITNNYNSTIIDIGAKESSETLSINEFSNINFTISPNPVINKVKIQAKDNQSFNKILIYNINGQLVKEYKLENLSNNYTIENLNDLTSGVYIMEIFNRLKNNKKIKLLKK
tara:strand:+ start:130 stop:1824 length:1695 start_codon:yes stop_codon:yes gene_type:complete